MLQALELSHAHGLQTGTKHGEWTDGMNKDVDSTYKHCIVLGLVIVQIKYTYFATLYSLCHLHGLGKTIAYIVYHIIIV